MMLSPAQVQRFWREWSKTCQAMHWTRQAGLSADQIDARRKELLAASGFSSLTKVDRTAGFTKVLNEMIVLQGTSLRAARETVDPSLNEARIRRKQIVDELIPCLELYVADVRTYMAEVLQFQDHLMRDLDLMYLNAHQLKHLQFTLAARLNALRNKAGETIHQMKLRAFVPCDCAQCVRARAAASLALPPLPAPEPQPKAEPDPF